MKKRLFLLALIISSSLAARAQSAAKEINVTIYNNNIGVIRELRTLEMAKGSSDLKISDIPREIIPATVKIDFDGRVIEQNYRYDIANNNSILSRYIGKKISLINEITNVERMLSGILVSINSKTFDKTSVVLQKDDGSLVIIPNIEFYQIALESMPDGFVMRPTLFWKVISNKGGEQDVELSYQTKGIRWNAEYILVLSEDDSRAELDSWVSIDNNSGASYENANLKLVAGNVRKVNRSQIRINSINTDGSSTFEGGFGLGEMPNFKEENLFEYHVYEMQNKTTISDFEKKQIALFSSNRIAIEKKMKFSIPDITTENLHPTTVIEFENSEVNHLGSPIPEGNFQVMKKSGKAKELVGECKVGHTPKDEKVKLEIGDVFDVVIDASLTADEKISQSIDEIEYSIRIRNHKKEDIFLDLEKYISGSYQVQSCSEKHENDNAHKIKIPVKVKADSEKTVTLRVRTKK